MSNNNPYTLHTTLKPNRTYSCFGIKLKVKEQVDTFSNNGNFSIHINNINLKEIESKGKGISKDAPIFCYVKESKQTHIAKLQDKTTSINIQIDKNLPKDSNGNLIPIIPKLVFLSFIPFRDSKEANNSPSQKIALTADDINKGYYNVDFKIPLRDFGEWEGNGERREILTPLPQRYASNDDMASSDFIKRQEWEKFKKYYLDIHEVNNTEMKEARERIGKDKLQEWEIMFRDNIDIFIMAEARYYKIGKAIHKEFMKHPSNYVNTCTARLSKALYDYGISIKRLNGMKTAYLANAGTNAKPYKILVKVKDMITFLKESGHFGKTIEFEPDKNQTNQQFCKETLSSFDGNGIVAMDIMGWGDANGHIVPWDNDNKTFLDDKDFLDNDEADYTVTKVYFWKIP